MSQIKNIEKIPEEVRELTEIGLGEALKKGSLGKMKINFLQIENSLSGGKTGAVVFVARYGVKDKTTFVRVLKIAPKDICESENEGYVKTRETLLDIFSQVEYYTEDEFVYTETHRKDLINQVLTMSASSTVDEPTVIKSTSSQKDNSKSYGILLYQDVGTVAASDLKGIAKYFTNKILKGDNEHKPEVKEETEKFSRELSLLMQKEVFLGLKKGLYGTVKRKDVNLSDYYGKKLVSDKVKQGLAELKVIDETLPDHAAIVEYFNINATYHEVNYVHGDLNPENVLVWENERGFLSCKLIDFGEVIPKKKDNFNPLFWDFSRLLGEMILNFVEEIFVANPNDEVNPLEGEQTFVRLQEGSSNMKLHSVDSILNDFWSVVEAFFKNDPTKLENANPKIEYISRIYLSTLFDFINEAKSGLKDLRRAEVMQDYFYCQILFFIFFAKFQRENPYKRLFGVKFALKLYEYANSGEAGLQSLILSLEKFYFDFSSAQAKNKQPQIGPVTGARSPFMGLSYFQEKDKEFFFGREKFTEELLKAIDEKPIVALAGASGSGKSSVVHAGVIPKLREQGYLIYKFRPGANPYQAAMNALNTVPSGRELTHALRERFKENPGKKIFLLGDQFEELFTLCTDTRQREDLGQALIDSAKEFKDRFRFFITIRSDFWTKLLEDAGFASVIGNSGDHKALGERFFLSAMNTEELRSTIERPLAVSKLFIQDGLTDLILTSISKEPGSLPLLEFCLHELWKKQVDFTLNYNAYKEIGEVKGALATYADQVYNGLTEPEKESLKKIMLQLVQPGQGTEDTRRIALVEDVVSSVGDGYTRHLQMNSDFINALADKRLIVTGTNETGKQTLEVVHEALIREWKRLKEWINVDREFRVWQEKLRYVQNEWDTQGREDGLLLHGSSIAAAEDWYARRKEDLSEREIRFIEKSVAERDRIIREREEAKELEFQKEREAEARAKKTQRIITITSAAAAIVAIGLSWFAYGKMKDSEANEIKAEALFLQSNFNEKKDYMQSYYETLKAGIKGEALNEKYYMAKLTILSTFYSFVYNLQKPEVYSEPDKYPFALAGERISLAGHSSSVNSVSFSPVGKTIASASSDKNIKLWNAATGKELKTLAGHSNSVISVTFSPDGKTIASGSFDNTIKLWDASSGKELKTLAGHGSYVNSVTFSPDGKIIASGSEDNNIKLWDAATGKVLKTLIGHSSVVTSVTFSPAGKTIMSGSGDKNIKLWDATTGKELKTLAGHSSIVTSVTFSPDGKTIASGSDDNTIKLWDVATGKELKTLFGHSNSVMSITFSPDGKTIASGSFDKNIKLWDATTGKELKTLAGHSSIVTSVTFSPDGKTIASGSDDNTIKLWDVTNGKELKTLAGHSSGVNGVAFSPDGKTIASGSWDTNIKLWDMATGKELKTLAGHINFVLSVDFSPDGKTIASGSSDYTIKLWDVTNGQELKSLVGHSSFVNSVAFSSDGKTIASGSSDKTIKLWDIQTGKEIKTLYGHSDFVSSIRFSQDGKTIVSGSSDNTIKLWDVTTGKVLKTLFGHSFAVISVTFSPDGKTITSGSSDYTIKLWDVTKGKELKTFLGHSSSVGCVTFSSDGKTIASGSSDNTIKLWDVATGKELKTLAGYSSVVTSVTFSPDGKTIVSGSSDNTIKLWDVNIKALLPLACEDLKYQMEHWLTLKERSPFPIEEILDTQSKCEEIIASKPKVEPLGKEYEYLAEARKNLKESGEVEKEEDKKQKKENAISNLKEALKINPDFSPAKSEMIEIYFNSENPDLAMDLFSDKEYFYLRRARKYLLEVNDDKTKEEDKKLKKEKAITDYLEAIKINPKLTAAKEELARIYFDAGKEQEAFELEKQKEYLYLYRARKYLQEASSDTKKEEEKKIAKEKAIADLQEALKINSKLQPAKVELAKIYFEDKKYKEAFALDADNHNYLNTAARDLATKENPTHDELKEALEYSKKSNDLIEDNAFYLDTLAEVYLKLGDKVNAKKFNDQAKKIAEEKK